MDRRRALDALLIANLVASILHFGDNMVMFHEYPEPRWISGPHVVDALWLAITPLLALGAWLARRERRTAAVATLWVYGVLGLFVLGHYAYGSPWTLPLRIHALIALEAVAAAALIAAAPFLAGRRAVPG